MVDGPQASRVTRAVIAIVHTAVMTNYTPFSGTRRVSPSSLELSRVLWTMHSSVGKVITAAIYNVLTGRELRVSLGEELLESRLSRTDDGVLQQRANELRDILARRGWTDAAAQADTCTGVL